MLLMGQLPFNLV